MNKQIKYVVKANTIYIVLDGGKIDKWIASRLVPVFPCVKIKNNRKGL